MKISILKIFVWPMQNSHWDLLGSGNREVKDYNLQVTRRKFCGMKKKRELGKIVSTLFTVRTQEVWRDRGRRHSQGV